MMHKRFLVKKTLQSQVCLLCCTKDAFQLSVNTVNQQILAAIKFGVSQNKVIWRLFGGY